MTWLGWVTGFATAGVLLVLQASGLLPQGRWKVATLLIAVAAAVGLSLAIAAS